MGTKNGRNMSGVYGAEVLRLIQSRRIWILCGILWLYLMIQGTEIYREVGADREIIRGFWQQTVIQILRKKETVVLVASVSGIAHAASCMEDFQSFTWQGWMWEHISEERFLGILSELPV